MEIARAGAEAQNQKCRLLRRPPELRIQIYRAVFAGPFHTSTYTADHEHYRSVKRAFLGSYGLIQTCRALRREAGDLFWASHVVEFGSD